VSSAPPADPPVDADDAPDAPVDASSTAHQRTGKAAGLFEALRAQSPPPPADQADAVAGESAAAESADDATAGNEGTEPERDEREPASQSSGSLPGAGGELIDPVDRRDAAVVALEQTLARRIKRTLNDELNEVLDAHRRAESHEPVMLLPEAEGHVERFADAALPTLAAAASAGAELARAQWADAATETPRSRVGDLASELAAEVVAPLRQAVEGVDPGGDPAAELRGVYREARNEADRLASAAVLRASARAAIEQLPDGTVVRWVLAGEVIEGCEERAATTRTAAEERADEVGPPPLGPGCRCAPAPVPDGAVSPP
jgi:hypothetical protein